MKLIVSYVCVADVPRIWIKTSVKVWFLVVKMGLIYSLSYFWCKTQFISQDSSCMSDALNKIVPQKYLIGWCLILKRGIKKDSYDRILRAYPRNYFCLHNLAFYTWLFHNISPPHSSSFNASPLRDFKSHLL